MTTREVPEPWAQLMVQGGFTDQRGAANLSALARGADVSVETVRRLVHGVGRPIPETVEAVGEALRQPELVARLAGAPRAMGPYEPPPTAVWLDQPQRDAVTQIINLLAESRRAAAAASRPLAVVPTVDDLPAVEDLPTLEEAADWQAAQSGQPEPPAP